MKTPRALKETKVATEYIYDGSGNSSSESDPSSSDDDYAGTST